MKVLLIALLCGLVATQVFADGRQTVQQTVSAVEKSLEGAGRLWMAVDMPDCSSTLHAVEHKMKTKFGEFLKEALEKLVGGVEDRVDRVKGIVEKVTDKVAELKQQLRKLGDDAETKSKEAINLVRTKVHEIVDTLLESIKTKEDNLDQQLDEASKLKVKDLIKQIRERISEKVRGIRQYIKDIAIDNEAVRELKAILDKLNDSELASIMNNLFDLSGHEIRHLKEVYQKLRELAGKTNGVLKDKLYNLTGYVQSLWHNGVEELVERFHNIKSTLLEVIGDTKDFSVEAVKDALKHLEDYKEHLGDLYGKLVDSLKKVIGRF